MKRKILILITNLKIGGAEKVVVGLANNLQKEGREVEIITIEGFENNELEPTSGVKLTSLNCNRIREAPFKIIKKLANQEKYILIANMWPNTLVAVFAKIVFPKRLCLILVEHSNWTHVAEGIPTAIKLLISLSMNVFYRLASFIVTVSKGSANDLSTFSKLPSRRITTIYNPLILNVSGKNNADPNEIIEKWRKSTAIKLLAVGTLSKTKNFQMAINAVEQLKGKLDVDLLILGEGPEKNRLEIFIQSKNLTEKISISPPIRNVRLAYESADLLICTSNSESFSLVILEALEAGLPVVSTNCPHGPNEIIHDSSIGILVPVNDHISMAAAIQKSLRTEYDRKKLSQRAREFSIDKVTHEYERMFLSIENK